MQQLLSSLSRVNPFSRKQIFSQYKLPQDPTTNQQRFSISKDRKKSDQILIRQIRLFKFNLTSVLEQKNELINKFKHFEQRIDNVHEFVSGFNQGEKDDSQQVRNMFRELANQDQSLQLMNYMAPHIQQSIRKSKSAQPLYFLKSMILYRVMINVGNQLRQCLCLCEYRYEGECLRLGTMSNFNKSTTKANFTKSPYDAQRTILSYIQKIIVQSSKAMQAKVRETNNWETDRFLLQDDKSKACWKTLEELYNPKQVELIHFEMLNVLNEFDSLMEEFSKMLESHEIKYKKYQGVMDSIELMDRQMKQMQHTIEMKDQLLKNLSSNSTSSQQTSYYQPNQLQRLLQRQSTQQQSIQKNIKIYHINQKLFANYNTETNLISYYQLRKNYSLKLTKLQNRMETWKHQLQVIRDISTAYSQLDHVLNRKNVGSTNSNRNKKYLTSVSSADSQIVRFIVNLQEVHTKKNNQLYLFKKSILEHLKSRLGNDLGNIRLTSGPSRSVQTTKDSEILQKQKSFFLALLLTPNNTKKDYLIKNQNLIQEYIVFNSNIKNDRNIDTDRIRKYLWQFQVCQMIAQTSEALKTIQSGQTQSKQFPFTINKHLSQMQKKLTSSQPKDDSQIHQLLCNHIYDYQLFSRLFSTQLWKQYIILLDDVLDKDLNSSLNVNSSTLGNKMTLNQVVTFTQKLVSQIYLKPVQNILGIFYQALFQINHQTSFQLFAFQHFFWQTLCMSVSKMYNRIGFSFTQNMKEVSSLDPDDFLSVPCLTEMIKFKIKVKNIEEIILKLIKKLYNKLDNLHHDNLLHTIICLTYLINYLNFAYSLQDMKQKVIVLNRLRRCLTVQLMKLKYAKIYSATMQSSNSLSPRQVCMILGVQRYLTFKDPSQKLDSTLEFTENCQKYLDMLEKEIKPLTINVSPNFSSDKTISKIWNIQCFQEWFSDLYLTISDTKLSPLFLFSYFNILQNNLQELLKLVDSPQITTMKESEGFLIKMIKKENFYLKRQINKFKLLANQGIWQKFDKVLSDSLNEIEKSNFINEKKTNIDALKELQIRAKKVLLNVDKKYL